MLRVFLITAILSTIVNVQYVEAQFPRSQSSSGSLPGTEGRRSFAGVPGLGAPLSSDSSRFGMQPVVGSQSRTSHFSHPVSGRARYSGVGYDPIEGKFVKYRFWK